MSNLDELLELADNHRVNGEYDEAIALYDQILEQDAAHCKALHGRALSYCFTGLFDESIVELERMRDLHPGYVRGREDLFKTYLMLGMNDEAKGEMKNILEVDPDNAEVEKHRIYFPDFDAE
jgi:tetratricopeptide (TPR) repeat protein